MKERGLGLESGLGGARETGNVDSWQLRLCDLGQAECPSGLQPGSALTVIVLIPASGPAVGPKGEAMGRLRQAEGCVGHGVGEP